MPQRTRSPRSPQRSPGGYPPRWAEQQPLAELPQQPPRPTATVVPRTRSWFACSREMASPKEKGVVVPARHAVSHSASVGRRHPNHLVYRYASHQHTFTTGWFATLSAGNPSSSNPPWNRSCRWRARASQTPSSRRTPRSRQIACGMLAAWSRGPSELVSSTLEPGRGSHEQSFSAGEPCRGSEELASSNPGTLEGFARAKPFCWRTLQRFRRARKQQLGNPGRVRLSKTFPLPNPAEAQEDQQNGDSNASRVQDSPAGCTLGWLVGRNERSRRKSEP